MNKTFIALLAAAILGGFISALVVFKLTPEAVAPTDAPAARFANFANAPDDFRSAAVRSMAGVVYISTLEEQSPTLWDLYYGRSGNVRQGTGSGVIYTIDGYIVTNNHVVEGAQAIEVSLNDNRRFRAKLIGTYPEADLAVLKVDGLALPALEFANSDEAQVGDWVLAVGNPYNLSSTVTAGIVSARGRDINIIDSRNAIESFIQTDAAINPGNSGGALVNTKGEVIGINTAIYSRSGGYAGYGFAIPANLAARIVDEIIATGSYQQIVLGIDVSQLDEDYARQLGINIKQGVVVEELDASGLAARSGLQVGDVITEVDTRTLRSIAEFREAVSSRRRGSRLALTVLRRGERTAVVLQL